MELQVDITSSDLLLQQIITATTAIRSFMEIIFDRVHNSVQFTL